MGTRFSGGGFLRPKVQCRSPVSLVKNLKVVVPGPIAEQDEGLKQVRCVIPT